MDKKYTVSAARWQCLESRQVYDNAWINVSHHDVITPADTQGIYGVVNFKNIAVGIVPLDEQDNTWLVRQFRYPLQAQTWEIPEGGSLLGGDPLISAQRELREETGLVAGHWRQLLHLHTSNSVTDEQAFIYVATELTQGESALEVTEQDLEVEKISLRAAVQMALDGRITDAMSVAALLRLALEKGMQV